MAQRCSPKSGTETRPLEVPTEDENGYKEKDVFFFFFFLLYQQDIEVEGASRSGLDGDRVDALGSIGDGRCSPGTGLPVLLLFNKRTNAPDIVTEFGQ